MTTPKRKGHATSTSFKPGQSGNPAGKKKMDPELKEAIVANTPKLYKKGLALMRKAEKEGDLRTAATLCLGLLKKGVPDAPEMLQLTGAGGGPVKVSHVRDVLAAKLAARVSARGAAAAPGGDPPVTH